MVLMAAVSRLLGVPVKWTEDRLEHLLASSSATDRVGEVEAAFTSEGELTGLRFGNVVNLGAYIRAPEPASVPAPASAAAFGAPVPPAAAAPARAPAVPAVAPAVATCAATL